MNEFIRDRSASQTPRHASSRFKRWAWSTLQPSGNYRSGSVPTGCGTFFTACVRESSRSTLRRLNVVIRLDRIAAEFVAVHQTVLAVERHPLYVCRARSRCCRWARFGRPRRRSARDRTRSSLEREGSVLKPGTPWWHSYRR